MYLEIRPQQIHLKSFGFRENTHRNKMKGGEKYVWQPDLYTRFFARWGYQWSDFPHGIRSLLLGEEPVREKQEG